MKHLNNENEKRKRFYTVKEAARILGFSTNTIYKYLDEGSLRGRRLGGHGRFKIPYSEIAPYLSEDSIRTTTIEPHVAKKVGNGLTFFELLSRAFVGLGSVYVLWIFGIAFLNLTKPSPIADIATATWGYSERTFSGFGNLTTKLASVAVPKFLSKTPAEQDTGTNLIEEDLPSTDPSEFLKEEEDKAKLVLINVPIGTRVNVREEATSSSKVIAQIEISEEASKISEEGDWTKLNIRGLIKGWVNNQLLEEDLSMIADTQVLGRGSDFKGNKVVITETGTGWLRVRSAPGGDEIGKVYPGESYTLLDKIGDWFLIEGEEGKSLPADGQGWISSQFATIQSEE